MDNVIVIVGPTASGKTRLSIEMAKALNGEIISADSMQIYKYMDIGTAKPTSEEKQGIKHYLIDEVTPDEEFSVARYQELAGMYIKGILAKGKTPIIVGGTGLYISSLVDNIQYSETKTDWELREQLKKEAEEKGNVYLHNKLKEIDPLSAEKIHFNDIKRIIRAIEVYNYTGKPISYHNEVSRSRPPEYNYIVIGLTMDRERLYERINLRVDEMLKNGLLDEVRSLVEKGYHENAIAMQGLGYKEILWYFKGIASYNEAVDLLKRDTRRYAKRQLTWFRGMKNINWINVDEFSDISQLLKKVINCIAIYGILL